MRKTNSPNAPGTSGAPPEEAPVVERDDRDRAARQARITDGPGPIPPAPADPPPAPAADLPHRQHDDAEPYGTSVLPVRGAGKAGTPAASAGAGARSASGGRPAARRTPTRRTAADDALVDRVTGEELNARLRDTLSTFVDSPAEAVSDADEVTAQVAKLATDAIQARRAELERLRREAGDDTEQLRLALQKYRAFVEMMLKF
ncbi:hypothetical protein B4N89_12575 [Embleya scabrispora]|uniref:Uncharacterized protein n=1 Tax=Embleya scabrispora TaxID=159449 RepID=A0A1T3NXW5_9ACTN|nr:hypothetical protein [Embleya scabrispora]OPC81669.1 hypothetical protein B4N89_12575 [Embleya scabrispora]